MAELQGPVDQRARLSMPVRSSTIAAPRCSTSFSRRAAVSVETARSRPSGTQSTTGWWTTTDGSREREAITMSAPEYAVPATTTRPG